MITSILLHLSSQQAFGTPQLDDLAYKAIQVFCPTAKLSKPMDKYATSQPGPFSSIIYDFGRFEVGLSGRTGEVVIAAGMGDKIGTKVVSSDDVAVETAKGIIKALRPSIFSQLTFSSMVYSGSYGVKIGRSIDGISILGNGDTRFVTFDREKGYLQGLRLPPTETGIHRIDRWLPESKTLPKAVRFAFDTFKGPTQLNFDSIKKTYVGENWFRGMPNLNHRAFTDPALKNFLFPAYLVRYVDADSIRPTDQVPMQFIDVFVDAENNSIFGYIIYSAGGGQAAPAKSLDGEKFGEIKVGTKPEMDANVILKLVGMGGNPAGVPATVYSGTKAVNILVDVQHHLVWRGNSSYSTNSEFWKLF